MPPTNFFDLWDKALITNSFYVANMRDGTRVGFREAADTQITVNSAMESYGLLIDVWLIQHPPLDRPLREFGNIVDEKRDVEVRLGDIISIVELDNVEFDIPKP